MNDPKIMFQALRQCTKEGYSCDGCPLNNIEYSTEEPICFKQVENFMHGLEDNSKVMTVHDAIQMLMEIPNQEKKIHIIIREGY